MNEIEEALKSEEKEFWIADHERLMLIDIMTMVAMAISDGRLWFNKKDWAYNQQYVEFLNEMARRFANMPVEKEQ